MIRSIAVFFFIIFFSSAVSAQTGKVVDRVLCKADAAISYALYIPARDHQTALPVIYFFDPHGDGSLPLNKYKTVADEYGFILIGSNNSKNGNDWSTTEHIWQQIFDDTQIRIKFNKDRIYTCGFSGGAKVAGYVALQHPVVKGVIAGGAGLPDGTPAGDFRFSVTVIAGEGDLNLTDLVALDNALDKTHTRHRIIHFDGLHEWAPAKTMSLAFAGLQFDAMRQGLLPKDAPFINGYIMGSKKRFATYSQAQQLIKAAWECQLSIHCLDGLTTETGWFNAKAASLAGNAGYQQQRRVQENLLARELSIKEEYQQHFQQDDPGYWSRIIHDLQEKARAKTAESAMHQRLLAYLSLAFYSISHQLINTNINNEARHFVELYKLVDPTNSEAWYFSAILHARDGLTRDTENDLLKAVATGFRDKGRLQQQPEFFKLSPRLNVDRIVAAMSAH